MPYTIATKYKPILIPFRLFVNIKPAISDTNDNIRPTTYIVVLSMKSLNIDAITKPVKTYFEISIK